MDKPTGNVRSRGLGRAGSANKQENIGGRGGSGRGAAQGQASQQAIGPANLPQPSAWGAPSGDGPSRGRARGTPVLHQAPSSGGVIQRPPAPAAVGRATVHRRQPPAEGAESSVLIRGAIRGKRVLHELVRSRPQDLSTKMGTSGQRITLQANYFRVLKKPSWLIHMYRVDFSPDVDLMHLRRAYLNEHKAKLGGYVFDGTLIFCTAYLVELNKTTEWYTKNREEQTIQIKIKNVGHVDSTDHQILQVLNLIMRRCLQGLELQLVGRNYFDPKAKIQVNDYRIEIWPGYLTSIRQHEVDLLLGVEISHKVLRTDTVHDILSTCLRESGRDYQHHFKQTIIGTTVITYYNQKTYRVDDVDFQLTPDSQFETKNGEKVRYRDYYREKYNTIIKDLKQPLLLSRPTERDIRGGQKGLIMLIPELCNATGLTENMRKDIRLMRAMSDNTRLNPEQRIQRLRVFNERVQNSRQSSDCLNIWNIKLDNSLVELSGRILPPQKIVFGENRQYTCDVNVDWTREIRKGPMFVQVDLTNWYVIVPQRHEMVAQNFVRDCMVAAKSMKMRIAEPIYEKLPDDRNTSYSRGIENAAAKDPKMLMVVVQGNSEDRYSCIKKKCCVDRPIPSQVVTLRAMTPKSGASNLSVATKVVIQMNAKMRGAPWITSIPLSGLMTVGFDVCHSSKEKNKSYGALVATMDLQKKQRYFSSVMAHMKGQELSNEIAMNMTFALKQYREAHGCLPLNILFYRDGVGEGQLHQVFENEVKVIKDKLDEIYTNAGVEKCRFTFIVVSKRINTRLFYNKKNPPPGTVVDDVITLPERYDFYIVSQSIRHGTVSPTSYNVLHDGMGLGADKYQILTYRMTHLYYNWSGALRVPAVCQYAHKLAFLVAEAIHQAPSNVLQNQLYFL